MFDKSNNQSDPHGYFGENKDIPMCIVMAYIKFKCSMYIVSVRMGFVVLFPSGVFTTCVFSWCVLRIGFLLAFNWEAIWRNRTSQSLAFCWKIRHIHIIGETSRSTHPLRFAFSNLSTVCNRIGMLS